MASPPLERQISLPPEPKTPEKKQKRLARDVIETDSDEECVFSAVAAAKEKHYDEEIVHHAINGEKPAKAKNVNSEKVGANDCGAKLPV